MRKFMATVLSIGMLFSVCACSNGGETGGTTTCTTCNTTITTTQSRNDAGSNNSVGSNAVTTTTTKTTKNEEINVVKMGADNTGKVDCTEILTEAHKQGVRVYYPNGTYLFNGRRLDLSGGVRFESMEGVCIRNSISDVNILNFDDQGNLIGLMQNHLEEDENTFNMMMGMSGSLVSPPLSQSKRQTTVDVMAYWYNDFGLECTRSAKTGWIGWYYWSWNHHNPDNMLNSTLKRDPYDPARHPLLGYYLGDKPQVLDWQSYWLYEYGVNVVSLLNLNRDGLSGWENPLHRDHWMYQLFNNTPNFKNLRYVLNGEYSYVGQYSAEEEQRVRNKFFEMVDKVYSKYDNYYYIEKNGKKYPVITILEETQYLTYFNGAKNVRAFYIELADYFRAHGFGGFALFARMPIALGDMSNKGVLRYESSYTPNYTVPHHTNQYTYSDLVENFDPPTDSGKIMALATSIHTQKPHESNWSCPGSTPKLFEEYMKKAVSHLQKNPQMPQVLTVYNVSEWAEGGTGLVPTVKDRFGYLEAIRESVVKKSIY